MAAKIVHGPKFRNLQAVGLALGERALGLDSHVMSYDTIDYCEPDAAQPLPADFLYQFHFPSEWNRRSWMERILELGRGVYQLPRNIRLLRSIVRSADVFNFYAGYSLLPVPLDISALHLLRYRELSYLRSRGKKIFLHYQGCDLRTQQLALRDSNDHRCCEGCRFISNYCSAANSKQRMSIIEHRVKPHVDGFIVTTPDLKLILPEAHVIPKSHVDVEHLNPLSPRSLATTSTLKIVHAPSNPNFKGTSYVRAAVDQLNSEGRKTELLLLQGVSRSQVADRAREADLAVDQLLAGWYGGFAVEMMALGLPVVVNLDPRAKALWPFADPPTLQATAATLTDTLRDCWENRDLLRAHAERGPDYVRVAHHRIMLAERMRELYRQSGALL